MFTFPVIVDFVNFCALRIKMYSSVYLSMEKGKIYLHREEKTLQEVNRLCLSSAWVLESPHIPDLSTKLN